MDSPVQPEQLAPPEAQTRAVGLGVASAIVTLPVALLARSAAPSPVNVPILSSDSRFFYILALLISVGFGVFVYTTDRDRGWARSGGVALGYRWIADQGRGTAGLMPALTLATVYLLLARYHSWPIVLVSPLLAGSGVFVAILARRAIFDSDLPTRRSARVALLSSAYLTCFVALSLVYALRMRTFLAAPLIALVAGLVVMIATDGLDVQFRRRVILSASGAIVIAQSVWALDYWNLLGWWGGVILAAASALISTAVAFEIGERMSANMAARLAGGMVAVVLVVAVIAGSPA